LSRGKNRVAVWLDIKERNDRDVIYWLKYKVAPKERGKIVRKALEEFRREGYSCGEFDENTLIVGEAVLSRLQAVFPDREINDELIQTILTRGIRSLKEEEEEMERLRMLNVLKEV